MNKAKYLKRENKNWPSVLTVVPRVDWPDMADRLPVGRQPIEVWRSKTFLVQVYLQDGYERLSVLRTEFGAGGRMRDGITWDELQRLKHQCGRGEKWAVEIFPADDKVVNVQNMRHLFILPEAPPFAWIKK